MAVMAILGVLTLGGCDDEAPLGIEPGPEQAVGTWSAEGGLGALTTTEGGEAIDWLERGASVLLVLEDDGTTQGRLFVPGGNEDGSDLDVELEGTWSMDGSTVTFGHEADTFIRDMSFQLDGDRLTGSESFGGTTVTLTLVRR